jgi:hypothetical protein
MARRLLLASLLLLAAGAGSAQAAPHTVRAAEGVVAATLSYEPSTDRSGDFSITNAQLGISRGGQSIYQQPVSAPACGGSACLLEPPEVLELVLQTRDLEGTGEANVLLYLGTGGAQCCSVVQVFSYDPGVMAYRVAEHNFNESGALVSDLDDDGKFEFESADDRFDYAFTSSILSGVPVQIWSFHEGSFLDVTRSFPSVIAADAERQFRRFVANRRHGLGLGFIAAWAADEDLLGRPARVASTLAREARLRHLRSGDRLSPGGAAFIAKLQRFLAKTGYRP